MTYFVRQFLHRERPLALGIATVVLLWLVPLATDDVRLNAQASNSKGYWTLKTSGFETHPCVRVRGDGSSVSGLAWKPSHIAGNYTDALYVVRRSYQEAENRY